jgi:hypothetical protein
MGLVRLKRKEKMAQCLIDEAGRQISSYGVFVAED